MRKNLKKLLSSALAAAMLAGLCPVPTAWAAQNTDTPGNVEPSPLADNGGDIIEHPDAAVAEMDGTTYATLAEAFRAVPTDGIATTITLLQNTTEFVTVQGGQNIELNMANKNLTAPTGQPAIGIDGGKLTIVSPGGNWEAAETNCIRSDGGSATVMLKSGSMTMRSAAIWNKGGDDAIYALGDSTVTLHSGYVRADNGDAIFATGDSTVTLRSGYVRADNGNAIYAIDYSTVETGDASDPNDVYVFGRLNKLMEGSIVIKKGYFADDPTPYLANNGLAAIPTFLSGYSYRVGPVSEGVAELNGNIYGSVKAALEAAKDQPWPTIKLRDSTRESVTVNTNTNINLDLNGHSFVSAPDDPFSDPNEPNLEYPRPLQWRVAAS